MSSILIVDDEPGVRSALSGVLRDEGLDVEAAATGEECLERAARTAYDVIVLDVWLPGIDGIVTLQRLRERKSDAQIVMISGHGNIESAVKAIKMGAFDFVEKPLSLEKTMLVVRNALRQRDLSSRTAPYAPAWIVSSSWWARALPCGTCASRWRGPRRPTDGF